MLTVNAKTDECSKSGDKIEVKKETEETEEDLKVNGDGDYHNDREA